MRAALPFILLVYSAPVPAVEDEPPTLPPLYRVELIVFTHAKGAPDARPIDELEDFSALPDPLVLAASARQDTGDRAVGVSRTGTVPAAAAEQREIPALPTPYTAVGELSETMARAWRRLVDSAAHRPLTWLSWYQPAIPNTRTPQIRVHDSQVVQTGWPDPEFDPPLAEEAVALPEPETVHFYRVDGSVRLRQSQFLHLDIDLSWREPAPSLLPGNERADGDQGWRLHRLAQSRTVRRDRLEYFDSSWLGVLALITRFEQPEIQAPAEAEDKETEITNEEIK